MSDLPYWVQMLQALSVPCLTGIGAIIALQQMRIAQNKLDHDNYERRAKVYDATYNLLKGTVRYENVSRKLLKRFQETFPEAPFHFDDNILEYLDLIDKEASSVLVAQEALSSMTPGPERTEIEEEMKRELAWLQEQIQSNELINQFRPALIKKPRFGIWYG
ncbi:MULTISPECIES: hypothetical protein [unclassified Bradyrhizobium]|uniref:hypothetical protein n=1 Tax=unclassified Bradyrhizobium TaxID=2631580 RepID=UPI0028EA61BF|nr:MULTISPECIES: hypothetical protein [unclassified Bradyrhizobium]